MKARRIWQVLVLLVSHVLLFVIARNHLAAGKTSAMSDALAGAGGPPASAKSEARLEKSTNYRQLLAELPGSKLDWLDYETARKELFREWIQHDLHGAMDMLYGPETRALNEDLAKDLEEDLRAEILRQPLAVWQWLQEGRYGSGRPEVYGLWMQALILGGESKLALHLMAEGPKINLTGSLDQIFREGNADLIAVARGFFMGLDPKTQRQSYDQVNGYAARKLDLAHGDVAGCLRDESEAQLREGIAGAWVKRELRFLPADEAAAKLKTLPADVRAAAVEWLVGSERHGGYDGMVELLAAIDREGLWQDRQRYDPNGWLANLTPENLAGQDVWNFLDEREKDRDPNRIIGEISQIGNAGVREGALGRAAEAIYRAGRDDELQELVDRMPSAADRDAVLEGLLGFLTPDSGGHYAAILNKVSDENLKKRYTQRLQDSE